jgi:hypothetical protein
MIKELNNKSMAIGVPGLLIQTVGLFINPVVTLAGAVLLIIGMAYYAKAKGHSGYFGLFGLLSWFGIIVLICLKDRHPTEQEIQARKKTRPKDIILGILLGLGLIIGVPLILAIIFGLMGN